MKNLTKLFVFAISLAGLTTSANAQSTATATTTATLIVPISIEKTTDMNFGTIASSATSGTVVLNYANLATVSSGVTSPNDGTGATTASFTVTGAGTSNYSIGIPASIILSDGANTLTVDNITADVTTGLLEAGGTQIINIGARLNVPANSPDGVYTNTSTDVATGLFVTVNYN